MLSQELRSQVQYVDVLVIGAGPAGMAAAIAAREARPVFPGEQRAPGSRLDEPQDGLADRRLAATRFAHQPQRAAGRQR